MVDAHSPSAKGILKSYVPCAGREVVHKVQKCQSLAFSYSVFGDNIHSFAPGNISTSRDSQCIGGVPSLSPDLIFAATITAVFDLMLDSTKGKC